MAAPSRRDVRTGEDFEPDCPLTRHPPAVSGADLMHPLAVGPAPRILTRCDDRTAELADLSRGVCLVAAPGGAVLVLMIRRVFRSRTAQIFQQSFFDFAASEIWRGCHNCLLQGAMESSF